MARISYNTHLPASEFRQSARTIYGWAEVIHVMRSSLLEYVSINGRGISRRSKMGNVTNKYRRNVTKSIFKREKYIAR